MPSSNPIDEKIAVLSLDTKKFEENAERAVKAFQDMNKNISNQSVDISKISSTLDNIGGRFSLLGEIGQEIFQRIARYAVDAGEKIVNALAFQGMRDGFQEYELKMGSVQTIMASTGESLDVVMKKLNELNTYSDKTIYSFADMTTNIGKFTNAGVKLDMAVDAIQGVANVAAVSGANAQEASRAMYNFAQALSAGYVKLIDWKSIENANMATVEFKNQLLDTAVAVGTVKKQADGMYKVLSQNAKGQTMDEAISATKLFNDSLSYQWMTTDVLTKTLGKYADETTKIGKKAFASAQDIKTFTQMMDTIKESIGSGWAQTWEAIIGDFDEAKELWTNVGSVIDKFVQNQANARNKLVEDWKKLGGRDDIIEGFKYLGVALTKASKPIFDAFSHLIPKVTGKDLAELSAKFKDFAKTLSETDFSKWESKWKGVGEGIDKVKDAVIEITDILGNTLKKAIEYLDISKLLKGAGILVFIKLLNSLADAFESASEVMEKFAGLFKKIKFSEVRTQLGALLSTLRGFGSSLSSLSTGVKWAGIAAAALAIKQIADAVKILADITTQNTAGAIGAILAIKTIFKELRSVFMYVEFKPGGAIAFNVIARSVKIMAKAINELNGIDTKSAITSVISLSVLIKVLGKAIDSMSGIESGFQTVLKSGSFVLLGVAVKEIASALSILSGIDAGGLMASVVALSSAIGVLSMIMQYLGTMDFSAVLKASVASIGLVALAGSLTILAVAFKVLSSCKIDNLSEQLAGLTVVLVIMSAACYALQGAALGVGLFVAATAGLVLAGAALMEMAKAFKMVQGLDMKKIGSEIGGALDSISEGLFAMTLGIVGASVLLTASKGIVKLAKALKTLEGVDISNATKNMKTLLEGISDGTMSFWKVTAGQTRVFEKTADGLVTLTKALRNMSNLEIGNTGPQLKDVLTNIADGLFNFWNVMGSSASTLKEASGAFESLANMMIKLENFKPSGNLGFVIRETLSGIADGLFRMTVSGAGAAALKMVAPSLTAFAKGVKSLEGVNFSAVGPGLRTFLQDLGVGLNSLTVSGFGADALRMATKPLKELAKSIKAFNSITNMESISTGLYSILTTLGYGLNSMFLGKAGSMALKDVGEALKNIAPALVKLKEVEMEGASSGIYEFLLNLSEGLKKMKDVQNGAKSLDIASKSFAPLAKGLRSLQRVADFGNMGESIKSLFTGMGDGIKSFNKDTRGAEAFKTIGPSIKDLAASMKTLSKIESDKIGQALGDTFKAIGDASSNITDLSEVESTMTTLGPVLKVFANALVEISEIKTGLDSETLKGLITAIGTGVESFNTLAPDTPAKIEKIAPNIKSLAEGVKELTGVNLNGVGDSLKSILTGIGDGLTSMTTDQSASVVFQTISEPMKDFAKALKTLTSVNLDDIGGKLLNVLCNIGQGLGYFKDIKGQTTDSFTNSAKALVSFGKAFKSFKGVSLGSLSDSLPRVLQGVSTGMAEYKEIDPNSITNLSNVSSSLVTFCDAVSKITGKKLNGVGQNVKMVLDSIGKGLTSFKDAGDGANNLKKIKDVLEPLSKMIKKIGGTEEFSEDIGKKIKKTLEGIGNGIASFKDSEEEAKSLAKLKDVLVPFADSMTKISKADFKGISTKIKDSLTALGEGLISMEDSGDGVKNLKNMGTSLNDFAKGLTTLSKIENMDNTKNLKSLLEGLGEGIKSLNEDASGSSNFEKIASPIKTFTGALKDLCAIESLANSEKLEGILKGVAKGIASMNDAQNGATVMSTIADPIKKFADAIKTITSIEKMDNTKGLAKLISDIGESIGGFSEYQTGANIMEQMAEPIKTLAGAIKTLGGVKLADLNAQWGDLSKGIGNVIKAFEGKDDISGNITDISASLTDFGANISTMASDMKSMLDSVKMLKDLGEIDWSATFAGLQTSAEKGLSDAATKVSQSLSDMVKTLSDKAGDFSTKSGELGKAIVNGFIEGLGGDTVLSDKAESIAQSAVDALNKVSNGDGPVSSGANFCQGFINGMDSMMSEVVTKATSVGSAAYEALRASIAEHSPSRKTFKSGANFDLGFVGGLYDKLPVIIRGVKNVGGYALKALNSSGAMTPSITPVMNYDNLSISEISGGYVTVKGLNSFQNGFNPIASTISDIQAKMQEAYSEFNNSVKELSNRFEEYANKPPGETSLYVNGRKLASTTAKDYNIELGKLQKKSK